MHGVIFSDAPQGSKEWLEARSKGIGSTDAAVIMGVNKYKTPLELYEEKKGNAPELEDNWFMARGRALEPVLRQHYADTHGKEVKNVPGIVRHPEHKFMLASLDGFTDDGRLTEFKTATVNHGWGEEGSDEVPPAYLVQVQHAMIVTGLKVADVGVSIGGGEPKYYEVPADEELQQMIIDAEKAFWIGLENDVKPEAMSIEEKLQSNPIFDGQSVYAPQELGDLYEQLAMMKSAEKQAKQVMYQVEDQIKDFLISNRASILLDAEGKKLVSWNETKGRESIDSKALKAEQPAIYKKYTKTGKPYRTLRLYGV